MITITKTYEKFKTELDKIVFRAIYQKLTFFGFFYYSKAKDTKTKFRFINAISDGTKKKQTIKNCIEFLDDWDGLMKLTTTDRVKNQKLYQTVEYFNTCPLSEIIITDEDKKEIYKKDINLTIQLNLMNIPEVQKHFVLKQKTSNHFYLEENVKGSGLYYIELHFNLLDYNYGMKNMAHYLEHQLFSYLNNDVFGANAMTDTFGNIQLYFSMEPYCIKRFLDNLENVLREPFQERSDDFLEALRVSMETKDQDEEKEKKKRKDKKPTPLDFMFTFNTKLVDHPDIHHISYIFHNKYYLYKMVLEYSGPKYDNQNIVDQFLSLKLHKTDNGGSDAEKPSFVPEKMDEKYGPQKIFQYKMRKEDMLYLYQLQFNQKTYFEFNDKICVASEFFPKANKKNLPKNKRFIPFLWCPKQMFEQKTILKINHLLK